MNYKFKLKKGDEVIVLAGKDKGKMARLASGMSAARLRSPRGPSFRCFFPDPAAAAAPTMMVHGTARC